MIFLTGATGFLGGQVLARILAGEPNQNVLLLVRAADQAEAEARVRSVTDSLLPQDMRDSARQRLQVVCGDLSAEHFGIGEGQFRALAQQVTSVVHCAASTTFQQPLEVARRSNVAGTLHALQFAEIAARAHSSPLRFVHTSTAYVAGDTEQTVDASRLRLDLPFRNNYERSKAEAEILVQQSSDILSTVILRPSVIVGDSRTGHTSAFNVIYVPTKLIAMGLLSAFPAMPNAPCDVVPVDYVARATVDSLQRELQSGSSFHLCVGVGRESSPREIMEHLIRICNDHCPLGLRRLTPPFVSPELVLMVCNSLINATTKVKSLEKLLSLPTRMIQQLIPFIPYMTRNPRFDTSTTHQVLGVKPAPLFAHYAEQLFRFCIETNWGKLPGRTLQSSPLAEA